MWYFVPMTTVSFRNLKLRSWSLFVNNADYCAYNQKHMLQGKGGADHRRRGPAPWPARRLFTVYVQQHYVLHADIQMVVNYSLSKTECFQRHICELAICWMQRLHFRQYDRLCLFKIMDCDIYNLKIL